MDGWPLQLIVVALNDDALPPSLVEQLDASRAAGVIQLIDGGMLHKGDEGELAFASTPSLALDRGPYAGQLARLLFGCGSPADLPAWRTEPAPVAAVEPQVFGLSPDDLAEIADAIPRASHALVLVIEHRWTGGFAESVAFEQGALLAMGDVVPDTLLQLPAVRGSRREPA